MMGGDLGGITERLIAVGQQASEVTQANEFSFGRRDDLPVRDAIKDAHQEWHLGQHDRENQCR
jgi:hypothetical protein